MNKKLIAKIVIAGVAVYGMYKIYKETEKAEKEKAEKLKKYRDNVLEELEGTLNKMEDWYDTVEKLTLNNEKLKPADRAYAFELYKEKYQAILDAKSEKEIDKARKEFEEFLRIITETKESETVEAMLKIYSDKKALEEKIRSEQAALNVELEKNKALVNAIEKIGTKVVCGLME